MLLFQPCEEFGNGAQSMVQEGLVQKVPRPEVCTAQHVITEPAAGTVAVAEGPVLSMAATVHVRVFGAGSHGSMPHLGVDPVVLAAKIILSAQTLVSREVAPSDFAVVTVGAVEAGSSANVIPDSALLKVNVRAYDTAILEHLVAGLERIVRAECEAARSPREPEFERVGLYPLTSNDPAATAAVRRALVGQFGEDHVMVMEPATTSEDFSLIPEAFGVPSCYWGIGGYVEGSEVFPNHSPRWAPALQPTLRTGTAAATAAILGLLADGILAAPGARGPTRLRTAGPSPGPDDTRGAERDPLPWWSGGPPIAVPPAHAPSCRPPPSPDGSRTRYR